MHFYTFSEATSAKGEANGVADYMEPLRYKTHIYADVLYRGGCAFVLRRAMKCHTAFIGGYPSCTIVEIRGAVA